MFSRILLAAVLTACMAVTGCPFARAASPAPRVPGLKLTVSPPILDVGARGTFTVSASSWPGPASVSLRFTSPHHGFSGSMLWDVACKCFRLQVSLVKQVHPLERASATAYVRVGKMTVPASTGFFIRGLAPGGRTYAPGGAPILSGWVSDPSPSPGEYEHYCAWVRAADSLGIPGVRVRIDVHFKGGVQHLNGGKTSTVGTACVHRSIGKPPPKVKVPVDIYAGSQHVRTSFTPRA